MQHRYATSLIAYLAANFDDTFQERSWSDNTSYGVGLLSEFDNGYVATNYAEPFTDCAAADGVQLSGLEILSHRVESASSSLCW